MRTSKSYWLSLVSAGFLACASKPLEPRAAASKPLDPLVELVEIPAVLCPHFANHFALSADGLREILRQEIQADTQHAVELEKCNGATRIEQSRRESAENALAHAQWWQRWGPLGVAIGVTLGVLGGTALGWGFAHAR